MLSVQADRGEKAKRVTFRVESVIFGVGSVTSQLYFKIVLHNVEGIFTNHLLLKLVLRGDTCCVDIYRASGGTQTKTFPGRQYNN
jgi:hypothetical protein